MATTRRKFLAEVGGGMFIATLGPSLAANLGLGRACAEDLPAALTFGKLEPLVSLMHSTPPDKLMPILTGMLRAGTSLEQLVSAAALANVRTFGGEDYIGFHTMMALAPAYQMSKELPEARRPLPVLKVLYRNSNRLQETGGGKTQVLRTATPGELSPGTPGDVALRDAVRRKDLPEAERTFARLSQGSPEDALNQLLLTVEDATEVHRVVMVWRAWSLLDLVGKEQAHTMLRQSVHYCTQNESEQYVKGHGAVRGVLPKLFDQYKLLGRALGSQTAEDAWLDRMSGTFLSSAPDQAAEAVAGALAEGMSPDSISQALSLAANQLVLRDPGRPAKWAQPNKPEGSVHGDSVGVHACDAVNAWCNIARVSNARNTAAGLMLAAYEIARDGRMPGIDLTTMQPRPFENELSAVKSSDPKAMLDELDSAIRSNDQAHASAVVSRYGQLGHAERPVFDLLLRYAVSEDGALHAEKFYRTVSEEFARTRPAYRWRQLIALARVTASEHGYPAPGYAQSCELLKV